jgi:hypothetical protein
MGFFPGPTPAYTNPLIEPQFYKPNVFIISAVTLGMTTVVTATANMNYVIGQLVRLLIPFGAGCTELNEKTGYVLSSPATNAVEISIDSSQNVSPFITIIDQTLPQIVALGDINSGQTNTNGLNSNLTFIPGSFINISPL